MKYKAKKQKTLAGKWLASSALLTLLSGPVLETAALADTAGEVMTSQQPEGNQDTARKSVSSQVSQEEYESVKKLIEKGEKVTPAVKASSYTQADAINWARAQVGKSIDMDSNGSQCVDLTKAYSQTLFGYPILGDASQYAGRAFPGFSWNSAQANPQPGDIVVWTGGDGHVGIVIESSGENFKTVEQNVSGNRSVQIYSRNKSGLGNTNGIRQPYAGFLRPDYRKTAAVPDIPNAVHRLYNENNGDHYYTTNAAGARNLQNAGWKYDGIFFYQTSGAGAPVYVIYNPNSGEHFYTADRNEANSLSSAGWQNQGIAWYAPYSGSPVYRLYNPDPVKGKHFWTTSEGEKNGLIQAGWRYEGISFYG